MPSLVIKNRSMWTCTAIVVGAMLSARVSAAEFFVSPQGSPAGEGTRAEPWDLATGLSKTETVQPGDTLWVRGGTYRGGFTSRLEGSAGRPVTVRGRPGERATIDCRQGEDGGSLFRVRGSGTVFRDLEFTCSSPKRETDQPGSWPTDLSRGGIECRASHIKFINLVVHDVGVGIRFWDDGVGGEVTGCLLYNNGWEAPDRGHGHGIYAQNQHGVKRLEDNIVFHQFGNGIACYGSSKAYLDGFHLQGNVAFNNGAPTGEGTLGILVGGECPARGVSVIENYTYGSSLQLGYLWGPANGDAVVLDNHIHGGLYVKEFAELTLGGNTVVGPHNLVGAEWLESMDTQGNDWDANQYHQLEQRWSPFRIRVDGKQRGFSFPLWQEETGFDKTSRYSESRPTGTQIFYRPNQYERGRGHVIVYNWDERDAVELDLRSILPRGQEFTIVSAQNFYGPSVVNGTYRGQRVSLPMRAVPAAEPVGMPDCQLPVTEPEFGVFVVLPWTRPESR